MALFIGFLCFSAVALAILWRNYQRAFPMLYPETVRMMEGVLSSASLPFEATVNEAKSRFRSKVIFVVSSLNLRIKIGGSERPNRVVGAISWIRIGRVRKDNRTKAFDLMESIDHAYIPSALSDRSRTASATPRARHIVATGKVSTEGYWQGLRIFAIIYLVLCAFFFGSFFYMLLRFFDFLTSPDGIVGLIVVSATILVPAVFFLLEGITILTRYGTSLGRSFPLSHQDVIRIVELSLEKQGIGYSLRRNKKDIALLIKPRRTFVLEKLGATIRVFGGEYPSSFIFISGFSSQQKDEIRGVLRFMDDMFSPSMQDEGRQGEEKP